MSAIIYYQNEITKLKLRAFSLAALEIILGATVVEVRSMMERTSIQTTAVDVINIRVYLRRDFTSSRSDNHTICDSKHNLFVVNQMTKSTLF